MLEQQELIVEDVVLALADDVPRTKEEREGAPVVHRFFPGGPAVYALSVLPADAGATAAVETAAGDILGIYRQRAGYRRVSRPPVAVAGADDAVLLDFTWADGHGVTMHSLALVAAVSDRVIVLHGAIPALHGPEVLADVESTLLATRLLPSEGSD